MEAMIAGLEKQFDARVGVYAVSLDDQQLVTHHPDDRFLYASTMKAISGGILLDAHHR